MTIMKGVSANSPHTPNPSLVRSCSELDNGRTIRRRMSGSVIAAVCVARDMVAGVAGVGSGLATVFDIVQRREGRGEMWCPWSCCGRGEGNVNCSLEVSGNGMARLMGDLMRIKNSSTSGILCPVLYLSTYLHQLQINNMNNEPARSPMSKTDGNSVQGTPPGIRTSRFPRPGPRDLYLPIPHLPVHDCESLRESAVLQHHARDNGLSQRGLCCRLLLVV